MANPQLKRDAAKALYVTNPQAKRDAVKTLYVTNPQAKRDAAKALYLTNPQAKRDAAKALYVANAATKRVKARIRYQTHPHALGKNKNFMGHEMYRRFKISFTVHEGHEMSNFLYIFHGLGQLRLDGS